MTRPMPKAGNRQVTRRKISWFLAVFDCQAKSGRLLINPEEYEKLSTAEKEKVCAFSQNAVVCLGIAEDPEPSGGYTITAADHLTHGSNRIHHWEVTAK